MVHQKNQIYRKRESSTRDTNEQNNVLQGWVNTVHQWGREDAIHQGRELLFGRMLFIKGGSYSLRGRRCSSRKGAVLWEGRCCSSMRDRSTVH
jgi:hypothetical protein